MGAWEKALPPDFNGTFCPPGVSITVKTEQNPSPLAGEKGDLVGLRKTILTLCGVVFCALPALAAVKAGDRAPDFRLTGVDGKNYALSDYKGRVVVINLLGWN